MSDSSATYTVAILDDEEFWCSALVGLLMRDTRVRIAGTALSQDEAVALASKTMPDVFLVDMLLGSQTQNGVTATIAIREASPATKIVILTSSKNDGEVIEAVSAGAEGYLMKDDCEDLLPLIVKHLDGRFSPNLVVMRELNRLRQEDAARKLTSQEQQIIEALSQGVPRSQLAQEMCKSESTIKSQISSILRKLGVSTVAEAVDKIKHGGVSYPRGGLDK